MSVENKSSMGDVIWDLTKIIAVASATAILIKTVLKRG